MYAVIKALVTQYACHPLAVPFAAFYGILGTLFEIVPVTWVLSLLIALNPNRWKRFLIASVAGASVGAFILTWAFHSWGLSWIAANYPDLISSSGWQSVEVWVEKYGVLALTAVAASPLALTPALAICGLMKMSLAWAGMAVSLGKFVKYAVVALLARKSALLGNPSNIRSRERKIS